MIGFGRHALDHVLGHRALGREADEDVSACHRLVQGARLGHHGVAGLPLVHALGAALVDHALGVAQDRLVVRQAHALDQLHAGDRSGARAVHHHPDVLDGPPGEVQRVDQAGGGDDGRAVLIVVEHRDVHHLAQLLLDDEAFRRLDVLQVDAAERRPQVAHRIDELVDVVGVDFEVHRIDVGEALEQHRLAFHHRLGRQRAEIAEAEHRRAVGDDRDQVALGGVVVRGVGVLLDREARPGDARRVRQGQIALGRQRLGGNDLDLARTPLAVENKRFLFGNARLIGGHGNGPGSPQFPRNIIIPCFPQGEPSGWHEFVPVAKVWPF